MQSAAYQEGQSSYFNTRGDYHNPYGPGTPGYDAFDRGWARALRQEPELRERFELLRARRYSRGRSRLDTKCDDSSSQGDYPRAHERTSR